MTGEGDAQPPRYQVLGLVGIGGMGVVYRAEDTRLGRTVALKFLPPMLTSGSRAKVRFLNEARAASALDHPNICTLYEVGETAEGQLYLAMAYYEGETLRRRLDRGPLAVEEALEVALQVARGLAKAHQQGIVHRDIKPANLMITADGLVKILDFGIARLPDDLLTGPLLGTPGYMAPEQARGGTVDARSDVWSLGVVLHEMLTGRRPDEEGGLPLADLGPGAPRGIDSLLSRMLAPEPGDRFPDAGALLADLTALQRAAGGAEGALSKDPGRRLRRPRRMPAWGVALATALALAAGLWLAGALRRHREAGAAPRPTFVRLTDLPGREWFPSLSPHGDFFVYARKVGDRSRLFLQQVGGGRPLDLLGEASQDDTQPAVSPDGRQIAFRSNREGGGIFLMGLMGESVRRVLDFGFNPAWSPDGREILCGADDSTNPRIRINTQSQIFRVNVESREVRRVPTGDAVQPSWSPHGFRIAYWGVSSAGQRVIWTIPAEGGAAVRVTEGKSLDWNPVWSPDGRYLYFASDRSGTTNLWRVPIDERSGSVGEPEPVTQSTEDNLQISLSRDGRQIAYSSDDSRAILEKIAFDPQKGATSGAAQVLDQTAQMMPALDASRDGRWLVYQTLAPQENLFIVHPDGTGKRQLTADRFKNRQPRWSPEGTRLAFYSNRGGRTYEVWTLTVDGNQLERAATSRGEWAFQPIWSPDGKQLACDLDEGQGHDENEALIDLTRPPAERRPRFLPSPGPGLGFVANSWSADGRLAGALHLNQPARRQLPGIVLYSLADRRYERLTDHGARVKWLSDSRHLLYLDAEGTKVLLLDAASRQSRQVLAAPAGSRYEDLSLSPDDRTLYLARSTEEGAIWLLAWK